MIMYEGESFEIEDIDKIKPESIDPYDIITYHKKMQNFYDCVFWTLMTKLVEYNHENMFYAIINNYQVIKKEIDNVCFLYQHENYEKHLEITIENLYKSCDTVFWESTLYGLHNPSRLYAYLDELTIKIFNKEVDTWEQILKTYKRKQAIINRLEYLLSMMEKVNKINVECLRELIITQSVIYKYRIKQLNDMQ